MTDPKEYLMGQFRQQFLGLGDALERPKIQRPQDRIWEQIQKLYPIEKQAFMMKWAMHLHKKRIAEEVIIEALFHARDARSPYALFNACGSQIQALITRVSEEKVGQRSEECKRAEVDFINALKVAVS